MVARWSTLFVKVSVAYVYRGTCLKEELPWAINNCFSLLFPNALSHWMIFYCIPRHSTDVNLNE